MILSFLFLSHLGAWSQEVRISEVMSNNDGVVIDEDGDETDWIELHNTTDNPMNLSGWHLTDDPADLTKWQFPNVTIVPRGFLLVFASNKDRVDPDTELHTNFRLNASGEFLALVRSDGATVEDELVLPQLPEGVSFGYQFMTGEVSVILDQGAPASALIPVEEVPGWRQPGFDDSAWLTGTTGVGLEAASMGAIFYTDLIGLDVLAMNSVNASVFIRTSFNLANAEQVVGLTLKMKYDDGFVAYLNGNEVTRSENAPVNPVFNSSANGSRSDSLAIEFEDFDLTEALSSLQSGDNVLAIHGMNSTASSNDLLMLPRLETQLAGNIDTSQVGQLSQASPGAANSIITFTGTVETPETQPSRGFYDSPVEVRAVTATPGAVIRYTIDGSEPTEASPNFPVSMMISETTNLRLKAFLDDARPSRTRTDTYLFVDDIVTEPRRSFNINGQLMRTGLDSQVLAETYEDASGQVVTVQDALKALPTLSITTNEDNLYDPATGIYVNAEQSWERPASAEWILPDGRKGFQIDSGLRIRGGFSRTKQFAKHSFRLFFRDEYGKGRLNYDFFNDGGITSYKRLDLRTTQAGSWAKDSNSMNTFLRDICFRDSSAAMGDVATRSAWCHIYLNGSYWGMYMTEERPEGNFGADYFGGDKEDYDLVKIWRPYDNKPFDTGFWIEDPAPAGNLDAYQRLHTAFLAGFDNNGEYFAVQGMAPDGIRDPNKERLLDVENMINFLLNIYHAAAVDNGITWWTGRDNLLNNLYGLYNRKDPDGFKWIQHDGEISYDRVARLFPSKLNRTGPFTDPRLNQFRYFNPQTLHDKLTSNAEYRLKVADLAYKHLKDTGALVRERMETRLDARAVQIDRAIVAQSARWGNRNLDRDVWVPAVRSQRDFYARAGDRADEVLGYLAADGLLPSVDRPEFTIPTGNVAPGTMAGLTTSEGSIYYTTDGSDPRAVGGAITGMEYNGTFPINGPLFIKARVFNGNEWSALTEGAFWTDNVPLLVTEIMYHSPEGEDIEFIELLNISGQTLDLRGYRLGRAVQVNLDTNFNSLEPGEYLVVVEDEEDFQSFYGEIGVMIAGEYRGGLSNAGEQIDLLFHDQILNSVKYDDNRNWPQAADGTGHSLVPIASALFNQVDGALDYGGNWRASSAMYGSPGSTDPLPGRSVVINEVIAHTMTGMAAPFDTNDALELYNPTSSPVDIGGWFLSNDAGELNKWQVPSGTVVAVGGYVVFDEDDFNPDRMSGFAFSRAGDAVYLTSPWGVVDVIRFKGQEFASSWVRYLDGEDHWVKGSPSLGSPNALTAPRVQLSELMYYPLPPAGRELEYIQLRNIGNDPFMLESAVKPFRIDGDVSYSFPAGTPLDAGEGLWIVAFDPVDTDKLNAFATAYGLNTAEERFFGPFIGELSNRSGRVALESAQATDHPFDVSWTVVDEVYYSSQQPWPTAAAGTGAPVVRTGPTSWGVMTMNDTDGDGMDDDWEQSFFGSLDQAKADWDDDGQDNLMEFIANTDPTDPLSFLLLKLEGTTLQWTARPERIYTVYWTSDLALPFLPLEAGLTSGTYQDSGRTAARGFYRLGVTLEE